MADLTPEQRERLGRHLSSDENSRLFAEVADLIAEERLEALRRVTDWLIGTTTTDEELDNLE